MTDDGLITPCPELPLPIGHIDQDSLWQIFIGSEELNKFRNKTYYPTCGNCKFWQFCRGCKALAYKASKNLFMDDLLCKKIFPNIFR